MKVKKAKIDIDSMVNAMLGNDNLPSKLPAPRELGDIGSANLNVRGCRMVIARIVIQAILDYQMLASKGIVKYGRMVRPLKSKNEVDGYAVKHDVEYLLTWFKDKSQMEFWLDLAHINFHPDYILRSLGMPT